VSNTHIFLLVSKPKQNTITFVQPHGWAAFFLIQIDFGSHVSKAGFEIKCTRTLIIFFLPILLKSRPTDEEVREQFRKSHTCPFQISGNDISRGLLELEGFMIMPTPASFQDLSSERLSEKEGLNNFPNPHSTLDPL